MQTLNGKPIYSISVAPEDTGMFCISLVDDPANESLFLAFNKEKETLQFAIQNEEQRMVRGVVMTCDTPILRRDGNGFEYYVTFSKPVLREMAQKYLANGFQNNVDTMHNFKLEDGIYMQELFIKDVENGINPKGFEDIKDGSLFCQFYVANDEVWKAIKEGTFKGFSLAGDFAVEEEVDEDFSACMQLIEQLQNKIKNAK